MVMVVNWVIIWTYLLQITREVKIVVNGAGAAAIACINLMITLGVKKENIITCDTRGVIYKDRKDGMNKWKENIAVDTT